MPRSAAAAGCVDFVLTPEKIAQELARIAQHSLVADLRKLTVSSRGDQAEPPPNGAGKEKGAPPPAKEENGFKKILLLLRNHSGVDFALYKSSTIQRRITRRMVLNKSATLQAYARFLRGNGQELDALYSEVLISVTSFSRNPEAFAFLQRKVFPKILPAQRDGPLRVWTLGCSTGQEAYSLAMAYTEFFDSVARPPKLQIFARDLNDAPPRKSPGRSLREQPGAGYFARPAAAFF